MKEKIIALATSLAQQHGLNAFSYNDLSKELNLAKASIHYYFPNKNDLAFEILSKYKESFFADLASNNLLSPVVQFKNYLNKFTQVANTKDKICLCMMYASDLFSLEPKTQELVRQFYLENELWLENLLSKTLNQNPKINAKLIFSQLQGLLVRARLMGDTQQFMDIENDLIKLYLIDTNN